MVLAYKEPHAKSRNVGPGPEQPRWCKRKVCLWALCDREDCPRVKWAKDAFAELGKDIGQREAEDYKLKDKRSDRDDYREFIGDLGKRNRNYVGLGDEDINCGKWGLLKECDNCGALIVKRLVCGREWCPYCGQDGSEHHKRRISRLIDRVFAMPIVGYFVFEVPLELRAEFGASWVLREARRYLQELLKREGFSRGVSRWHFYGEAKVEEMQDDQGELIQEIELGQYHPHLNILVERDGRGKIPKSQIERIRDLWTRWLEWRFGVSLGKVAPVWYGFRTIEGKIWHLIEYITRPTFKALTDDNRHIAEGLFHFNNTSWFGKFSDEDKARGRERFEDWLKELEAKGRTEDKSDVIDIEAWDRYETGLCPNCGGETAVLGVERVSDYEIVQDYGGGLLLVKEAQGP